MHHRKKAFSEKTEKNNLHVGNCMRDEGLHGERLHAVGKSEKDIDGILRWVDAFDSVGEDDSEDDGSIPGRQGMKDCDNQVISDYPGKQAFPYGGSWGFDGSSVLTSPPP